jgi:hypothetical protein
LILAGRLGRVVAHRAAQHRPVATRLERGEVGGAHGQRRIPRGAGDGLGEPRIVVGARAAGLVDVVEDLVVERQRQLARRVERHRDAVGAVPHPVVRVAAEVLVVGPVAVVARVGQAGEHAKAGQAQIAEPASRVHRRLLLQDGEALALLRRRQRPHDVEPRAVGQPVTREHHRRAGLRRQRGHRGVDPLAGARRPRPGAERQ